MGYTGLLIYAGVILVSLIGVFFLIRTKVQGKLLVFLVDKDKTLKHYLFTPRGKLFKFKKEDEAYVIESECVMLVKYPFGMPKFLQQIVPCLVYAKDNPKPLDPKALSVVPKGLTAQMVSSVVSENIVKGIVKGVEEERKQSRFPAWLIPAINIVLTIILAVMIYGMNSRIAQIVSYLKVVAPLK